eukprot:gene17198-biopygen8310
MHEQVPEKASPEAEKETQQNVASPLPHDDADADATAAADGGGSVAAADDDDDDGDGFPSIKGVGASGGKGRRPRLLCQLLFWRRHTHPNGL